MDFMGVIVDRPKSFKVRREYIEKGNIARSIEQWNQW